MSDIPAFFNRPYNQEAADKVRAGLRVAQVTVWAVVGEDDEVRWVDYGEPSYSKTREGAEQALEDIVRYEALRQSTPTPPTPKADETIHLFMSSGTGVITEAPSIVITDNE